MEKEAAQEIDVVTFLLPQDNSPPGNPHDDRLAVLALDGYGCRLLRRDAMSAIYAVEFDPQKFQPESLNWLARLIAIEQLQFENCELTDNDLEPLRQLPILTGLGLSNTKLTDSCIETLTSLPFLQVVHVDGTAITPEGLRQLDGKTQGAVGSHGGD
jgi:hypothetical protein